MATIEVEQADLERYRSSAVLLDALGKNPKARAAVLRAIKHVNPQASIPELDAAAPVYEAIGTIGKSVEALNKRLDDEAAEREKKTLIGSVEGEQERGRALLRKRGIMDEVIPEVEKLMTDRGLADYEAAGALYRENAPKDEPVMPTDFGQAWDFFGSGSDDKQQKEQDLMLSGRGRGAVTWSRGKIPEILREIRGGARAA